MSPFLDVFFFIRSASGSGLWYSIVDPDLDPDPHNFGKLNLDPYPHQSEKVEALDGHFRALEVPILEKSER